MTVIDLVLGAVPCWMTGVAVDAALVLIGWLCVREVPE